MAKKSGHSASKARTPASTGAADAAVGGGPGAGSDGALGRVLAELWEAVSAADVLGAEMRTAAFVALPRLTGSRPTEIEVDRLASALVNTASEHQTGEERAAFLRLLASLGARSIKREASRALAELTQDGVYPPSWVTSIGKAVPGRAWRLYDVFGDRESVLVTFSYDNAEHALLVGISLAGMPAVGMIGLTENADGILKTLQDNATPFERFETITLAEARQHIEAPLARAEENPDLELDRSSILFLPLARSRVRRLPAADPGQTVTYTAGDRAAVVEEFLRGPAAAGAGDPDSARFWATVLTAYSSRVPGEPPAQVGPHKLAAMLLVHVPSVFALTAGQRDGLRPAVTAWTRWAAERQGLDEAATDHLMMRLPEILDEFQAAYDDPRNVVARGYLRDVAAWDADLPWLADQLARREFAAPFPENRDPGVAAVDATEPAGRREIAVGEFAGCAPEGDDAIRLLTAVTRIAEEAWHDDPPSTWEKARRLLADGHSRHDVIHRLAR